MDEVEPGDEVRAYRQKSFPRRLLVISAGSLMHMLIAVTLLFGVYAVAGEDTVRDGVEVQTLVDGGAAQSAGVLAGDIVRSVDGESFTGANEFGELIRANDPGDAITLTVLRNGVEESIPVTLGVERHRRGSRWCFEFQHLRDDRSQRPSSCWQCCCRHRAVLVGVDQGRHQGPQPGQHLTHLTGSNDDLSSRPTTLVGVAGISDDVGENSGWAGMLLLLAVLNVFVGVFNMFPLLPLDGGHAAIALYERVREGARGGKQRYFADVERLMPFAMGVVTVLAMLMFAGLYLDITKPL